VPIKLAVLDRIRIESRVWSLDQQLYDLPRKQRIATRRETRSNLVSAAQKVGARQALANLGSSRQLAEDYLQAEFGPAPRASWVSAGIFLFTAALVLTSLLSEAAHGFADGVLAGDSHASGTFHWPGIAYLQSAVEYTTVNGHETLVGGALTPLAYVLLALAAIAVGRLWRVLPNWRGRKNSR
jgi:hypothetical protein